jgi:serine/threonine-protein kinase
MTADQLLFAVVRRTYEALHDRRVLRRLDAVAQRALMLAHVRTSFGLKQTQADASEQTATLNVGMGPTAQKLTGPVSWLAPSASLSSKRTRSLALEASYLTYSDTDVEHDLARIIGLLGKKAVRRRRRRLWSRGIRGVHLIIVLDEVDKLTSSPSGVEEIERLLGSLKNTLTMRGAHFLVVAGPDLHDHVVKDTSRGNSVYESVFAWRCYIPCSWDAADGLLEAVLDHQPAEVKQLARYLRFKARGIPRRLLQEFGELVRWEGEQPFLVITDQDEQRVAFYARLEELLELYFQESGQDRLFQVPIDEDRWRLTGYYIVDWILKKQGDSFTAMDIIGSGDNPELDPLLHVARSSVDRLLWHLEKHGVLSVVRDPSTPEATNYGGDPDAGLVSYMLADGLKNALLGIAWGNEGERAALEVSLRAPVSAGQVGEPNTPSAAKPYESVLRTIGDRYELIEVIGEGGQSTVYRGRDIVLDRDVAVKVPRRYHFGNSAGVARFRREAAIAARLDHPRIVRTYDVARDDDGWPILVMELVEGITLSALLHQSGPLKPVDAVRLGVQVAEGLSYLETFRVSRVDLKPSNIIVKPSKDAVIIDLGIAKITDATEITGPGNTFVGTPAYISPEALQGKEVDIRSDIYSLGVILYVCLTGKSPYSGENNVLVVIAAITSGRLDLSALADLPHLHDVITKATAIDPDDRFQHPAELLAALAGTQEDLSLDESGMTASFSPPSDVPEILPAQAVDDSPEQAQVYGLDCKNGHFNDPRLPYCVVCGIFIEQRTLVPHRGPRPPLGVFVLDDGTTLRLDTTYLIGRDPEQAPEVVAGEAVPVKVTDEDGSISRRHLRVKLDDWDVNLIDLGSVNGTAIQPPGDPSTYDIPPNEPVTIVPGTTVRIGRSRTMRFEYEQRAVPASAHGNGSSSDGRLGPYQLLRRLGEGGMGVVHLAVEPRQNIHVVIKELRREVVGDDVARRRLAREVEVMRRVRGRYLAEVVDADLSGDRPYIVTRYIPGPPLHELVKRDGPLAVGALLRLGQGMAEALAAMHAVGVIHRDLKPGNVLMDDGDPVVIDFGIAQSLDATRLTQTGMFIGTPGYLAPEIIEGQEAGPAVDVHAWAGTMLYAATGQPPFGKGTLEMIFFNITASKANVDGAPVLLQPLLRDAFSRNPSKRPTASQLISRLEQLEQGLS